MGLYLEYRRFVMKKNSTELVFILDKSGSMSSLEKDTIGGFNSMLEKQKKAADGWCGVTTGLFDDRCTILHDRIDIAEVKPMTDADYCADGMTALLDAVGTAIDRLKGVQKSTAGEDCAGKVLFVIITDGMENSSREYSLPKVRSMIEEQRSRGWEFVFLGANIDAVETAGNLGISRDFAADYVPDGKGTKMNFCAMAAAVSSFRSDGVLSKSCLDGIRMDHLKRGGRNS